MEARSVTASIRPLGGPNAVLVGGTLLAVLVAAVWYVTRYALPYLLLDPAEYQARAWIHGGFLFIHVAAGVVAILVGPFQLFSGIRRRTLSLHRLVGQVYLGAVAVGGLAASYMLTLPELSLNFRLGISGLAIAWLGTTGLAYAAILRRRITLHREWMIRSYVVTFGFVFFRVILELLLAIEVATPMEALAAASWGCWALPLLITEFVLQGRRIFRPVGGGHQG